MKTDAQIRAHIMRRVYVMYWARQLKKPAPRIVLVSALTLGLASSVSLVHVALNAFAVGSLVDLGTFAVAAFTGTTAWVQAMTLGIAGSVGWFVTDALRSIHHAVVPQAEVAPVQ